MDKQLIIVGFHRSGTSFVTEILHRAGLFVGEDLLGAMASNPYGHFEDREVLEIHGDILADNGLTWQVTDLRPFVIHPERWDAMRAFIENRRAEHRLWGFKDPRVCLFLGVWHHLLPEARHVVVFRDYLDCVYSLERRHAVDLFRQSGDPSAHLRLFAAADHGVNMWIAHNEALLSFVRRHPDSCVVVPLSAMKGGFPLVKHLNERFDIGLDEVPTSEVYDPSAMRSRPDPLAVSSLDVGMRAERVLKALFDRSVAPQRYQEVLMGERYFVPEDALSMHMENELLRFEVDYLRQRLEGEPPPAEVLEQQAHVEGLEARVAELQSARSDLRWFLERLDGSLAGPLLRRYGGFRTLRERWLD